MMMLNKNFQQWGIFYSDLSIDEAMVKYFGHHSAKQFIRGKPVRLVTKYGCFAVLRDTVTILMFTVEQNRPAFQLRTKKSPHYPLDLKLY
nr:unnamed protein product [Callosobruchus chinensis]